MAIWIFRIATVRCVIVSAMGSDPEAYFLSKGYGKQSHKPVSVLQPTNLDWSDIQPRWWAPDSLLARSLNPTRRRHWQGPGTHRSPSSAGVPDASPPSSLHVHGGVRNSTRVRESEHVGRERRVLIVTAGRLGSHLSVRPITRHRRSRLDDDADSLDESDSDRVPDEGRVVRR